MTRRERILLLIVGGFSLLALGYFALSTFFGEDPRLERIAELEQEVDRHELQVRRGVSARRQIGELEARALPANEQLARDRYQEWLFERVEQAGLRQWSIDPVATRSASRAGNPIGFSIRGVGNLGQLTEFLAAIYQVDYLHQIRQLHVRPLEGTKDLDVSLLVQAMSLPGVTTRNSLPPNPQPQMVQQELDMAVRAIIQRNLFSPENNSPQLAKIPDVKIELGKSVAIEPAAKDADQLDVLVWSIGGEPPAGSSIDNKTGKFRWTPKELGTFAVEIRVTDDGFPAKEARQQVAIQVVKPTPPPEKIAGPPPKPKPSFDAAKHAYVISTIQTGDRWQMWLHDRTTDKIEKLRLGDRIDIGTVQATVVRITQREVELDADGKRLLIEIGESLTEASELPAGGI